jgi:DNA uptake protein ComE-like DNA-binding protein
VSGRSVANEARNSEAYFAAVSGLHRTLIELAADTNAYDGLDETWMYVDSTQEDLLPNEDLSYQVSVLDECSKLNINTADEDALMQLPGMAQPVAEAIIDWRDSDDSPLPQGAEEDYYQTLSPPYHCANAPFRTIEELLLVEGPKTNQSQKGKPRPWIDLLTVYSTAKEEASDGEMRLDVNQATADQIAERMGTDLAAGDAQAIVDARQNQSGDAFNGIGALWQVMAGRERDQKTLRTKMAAIADKLTARPSEETLGATGLTGEGGQPSEEGMPTPPGSSGSGGMPNFPGGGGGSGGGSSGGGGGFGRTSNAPSPRGWSGDTPTPVVFLTAQLLAQAAPGTGQPSGFGGGGIPGFGGGGPTGMQGGAAPSGQGEEQQPEEQASAEAPPLAETPVPGLININTAPAEVLATLPQMTDAVVQAIVSQRESSPFTTRGDILNLQQVDQAVFIAIIDHITVCSSSYSLYALGMSGEHDVVSHVTAIIDATGDTPQIRYFRQDN